MPNRSVQVVLAVALGLLLLLARARGWLPSGDDEPSRAPAGAPAEGGYRPASAAPADALPGGALAAHEGRGHTLARHVGRTPEELRRRLKDEQKREVSTFPDVATAERAVAQALYERQAEVRRWLEEGARGDLDVEARLPAPVGEVLFVGEARPKPGRTVKVVLHGSRSFREGFGIRTAYVRP